MFLSNLKSSPVFVVNLSYIAILVPTRFRVSLKYTVFFRRKHFIRTSKLRLDKKIRTNYKQSEARITFSKK